MSCTSWSLHDAIELAKAGTPAGLIATTAFQGLAVSELSALGVAGLPLLVIEHPLGGERPDGVARRSRQALEQLASLIAGAATTGGIGRVGATPSSDTPPTDLSERAGFATESITLDDDPVAVLAEFSAREWCDGLPIVPPTAVGVAAMLGGATAPARSAPCRPCGGRPRSRSSP